MSPIKALISLILRIFGRKPIIQDTSSAQKFNNHGDQEAGNIGGGTNASMEEEERELEAKYGIWAFLKRIIDLVERKFSKNDHEEVKIIGRTLNNIGAKFLGEIKVGKTQRAMNQVQAIQQTKTKQKTI